ncbi:putative ATP-dependent RNA helicase DDX23 [Galemys pyrenaicus]|uniref:Putative ATP-dependent RNA helicase DDX23 n=1 Tax=Galemys pyrenaicus TaxID=202257 RepID=A0A8J6DTX3_GALPY|nr:putative ATP-dependent RNA helicase DDX23 [Galemys pyrenaicus]
MVLEGVNEAADRHWPILSEDYSITTKDGKIPNPPDSANTPLCYYTYWTSLISVVQGTNTYQVRQVPIRLQNLDITGVAKTGSGKTATFLIAVLVYIITCLKFDRIEESHRNSYAIILTPIDELTQKLKKKPSNLGSH